MSMHEQRVQWKKSLSRSLLYRNAFKSYENVDRCTAHAFSKGFSAFCCLFSLYKPFFCWAFMLHKKKKISRQPAGYPWSLKRDFFSVAIIRQNLIANVCSNSEDTSWIMISSYGWLDAKGQQHVPQGGVAGSIFVGSGAPSYLFMARRLIVTQCVSEWKRGPDATC